MSVSSNVSPNVCEAESQAERWRLASRIAFRFGFLYLGLFCLFTQILSGLLPFPIVHLPDLGTLPPMTPLVFWTAKHIFGYNKPLVYFGSGSGDKVYDWVLVVCLLIIAAIATVIWSVLDRRRPNYKTLHKWFRVFIRFALAGQMLIYGFSKVFPMQMPFPFLTRLLEPFGNFSPMGVLWSSVGASPAYEIFVGSAELFAGLLLIIPATSMLGALICLIDSVEIFALNMTYDVPVKLFAFHLILLSAFLLIPERSRLLRFCFVDCEIERPSMRRFFTGRGANQIATIAQIAFGVLLVGFNIYSMQKAWYRWGGGAPKSPLYGIWNVEQMSIDGSVRQPLLTDQERWRRVVFDFPQWTMFQHMDDSFMGFATSFDQKNNTLSLTNNRPPKWKSYLAVHRPRADTMMLDGQMGKQVVHIELKLMDRNKFLLVSRGFHWIQDYPYNR
jgi:hypothetical protein